MLLSPAYRGKLPNSTPSFQTDAELCAALQLLQTIIVDHPPCLAQLFGSVTSTVAGKETDVPPGITQVGFMLCNCSSVCSSVSLKCMLRSGFGFDSSVAA
jgi:hypothetical protein